MCVPKLGVGRRLIHIVNGSWNLEVARGMHGTFISFNYCQKHNFVKFTCTSDGEWFEETFLSISL